MITPSRSKSNVFFRSTSGVIANYTSPVIYRYYSTPITYSTLDFSDFGSWSNVTAAPIMYNTIESVSLPLIDGITGSSLGTITSRANCIPKVRIWDTLGWVPLVDESIIPCVALPELSNRIAACTDITSLAPTSYCSRGLWQVSIGGSGGVHGPPGSYTTGTHGAIAGNYYLYPGSSNQGIVRVGNNFYPHRIKVNIDIDMNSWYTGKFTDGSHYYNTGNPLYIEWTAAVVRATTTMTGATSTITDHSKYGNFTTAFDSCYRQVAQCMIPVF